MAKKDHVGYTHNLIITTPRLTLRDWNPDDPDDIAAVHRIRSDEAVLKYVTGSAPNAPYDTRAFLVEQQTSANFWGFVVELRSPDKLAVARKAEHIIGIVGGFPAPEFGYQFDPKYWGKGYAFEATRATIEAYWDLWPNGRLSIPESERHKIILQIRPDNEASVALAQKLGFKRAREERVEKAGPDGIKQLVTRDIYELKRPHQPGPGKPDLSVKGYEKIEAIDLEAVKQWNGVDRDHPPSVIKGIDLATVQSSSNDR